MRKRNAITVLLGITLLLLSLSVVSSVAVSSSQVSAYRFSAQGGTPGPPKEKPKPPKEKGIAYELFIEIDYMQGHEPNNTVLNYVHTYYLERGINMTFYVDEVVPSDPSVSDTDFWEIEATYNNKGDDAYGTGDTVFGTDGVYSSKWKWVLYGTTVEGEPNVVGYTASVILSIKYSTATGRIINIDALAGNYIFIADGTGDSWALNQGIEPYGPEAVVLMHELGHSIGILKIGWSGNYYTGLTLWEIYDPDASSVMSYLTEANAKLYEAWYYSKEYWRLKNMEYYKI